MGNRASFGQFPRQFSTSLFLPVDSLLRTHYNRLHYGGRMTDLPATNQDSETNQEGGESGRDRSTIAFPYNDLDDAVAVAKAVHSNGGTKAGVDQIAASLGHENIKSGAFRLKVAASRTFGLTTVAREEVTLTALGQRIIDPQQQAAAKVDAFMAVPLYRKLYDTYRGGVLPAGAALESSIAEFGVAPKQADKARHAFQRSADQAGMFASGRDRLVMPALGARSAEVAREDPLHRRRPSRRPGYTPLFRASYRRFRNPEPSGTPRPARSGSPPPSTSSGSSTARRKTPREVSEGGSTGGLHGSAVVSQAIRTPCIIRAVTFRFNERRAAQAASYLLRKRGGRSTYGQLVKLLYLADRKKLLERGAPITGDSLTAMEHGTALSIILDLMRKGPAKGAKLGKQWVQYVSKESGLDVAALAEETDELSRYELRLLDAIDAQYGHMTFSQLRDFTHELPEWKDQDPGTSSLPILPERVLELAGESTEDIETADENAQAVFAMQALAPR